jgi:hypothetical protein
VRDRQSGGALRDPQLVSAASDRVFRNSSTNTATFDRRMFAFTGLLR